MLNSILCLLYLKYCPRRGWWPPSCLPCCCWSRAWRSPSGCSTSHSVPVHNKDILVIQQRPIGQNLMLVRNRFTQMRLLLYRGIFVQNGAISLKLRIKNKKIQHSVNYLYNFLVVLPMKIVGRGRLSPP